MKEDIFVQRIELFQERLSDLFQQLAKDKSGQNPLLAQTISDMQAIMDELLIASQDIQQKNEQLAEAHVVIDAERDRYQTLFEFAPDGYLVTDQTGKILKSNRAAAAMLGVRQTNLVGKPLLVYIAKKFHPDFCRYLARLGKVKAELDQAFFEWDVSIQPRRKNPFWATLTVAIGQYGERWSPDRPTYMWMIHDITQLKQAQDNLKKAHDELEERVKERTKELIAANTALKLIMSELEIRNTELQEFAFATSHDLREPLRKISKFGELVMAHADGDMDSESADYVRRMVNAAHRMESMIAGLLEYARVSSQDQPFAQVDLNAIAKGVISDLDYSWFRVGGQVNIQPLPTITANPVQMRQLLQNLISNAVKFQRLSYPPQVEVWSEPLVEINPRRVPGRSYEQANWIELCVEDNGIGFEEKYLERMLQPFERLHGNGVYEGMGMGLAICRKIVERHGGKISASSTPGEGSTFIITLPVRQEAR